MNLIIASKADSASINLRDRLLEMSPWEKCGTFDGNDMWKITKTHGPFCVKGTHLIIIDKIHINAEKIDEVFERESSLKLSNIIFLSRHKAASGKPSLTVHPIGNWGDADYGGIKGEVTPASSDIMTSLLREMLGEFSQNCEILTTSAFVSMIVPLFVFLSLQRYFIRGLVAGSVKG